MTGRHVAKVRTFCRYVLTKVALFFCFSTSVVGFVLLQSHLSPLFVRFLAVAVPKSWLCRPAFARRRRETAVGTCLFAAFFPVRSPFAQKIPLRAERDEERTVSVVRNGSQRSVWRGSKSIA